MTRHDNADAALGEALERVSPVSDNLCAGAIRPFLEGVVRGDNDSLSLIAFAFCNAGCGLNYFVGELAVGPVEAHPGAPGGIQANDHHVPSRCELKLRGADMFFEARPGLKKAKWKVVNGCVVISRHGKHRTGKRRQKRAGLRKFPSRSILGEVARNGDQIRPLAVEREC